MHYILEKRDSSRKRYRQKTNEGVIQWGRGKGQFYHSLHISFISFSCSWFCSFSQLFCFHIWNFCTSLLGWTAHTNSLLALLVHSIKRSLRPWNFNIVKYIHSCEKADVGKMNWSGMSDNQFLLVSTQNNYSFRPRCLICLPCSFILQTIHQLPCFHQK